MTSHVLWARWKVVPGNGDEVERLLVELGRRTREEEGCRQWNAVRSLDDPDEFVFFEEYTDEAAFLSHGASAHVKELLPVALALVQSRERGAYRPVAAS